jgi:lipopolysaccharide transport system permease protein
VVFGTIAKIPTDGLPPALFYMAGITVWNYFSSCLNQTSTTFVSNAAIFGKVYFPRLVMPISVIITNLLRFAIQFCFFLAFLLYYYLNGSIIHPNLWILLTPILLIQMAGLGLGVGIILSSLTVKYRDLTQALTFGVQLWMYGTPIVYPLSQVPEKWQWIISLNPMTSIVEVFRYAFLGEGTIKLWLLGMSICITILILVLGIILFNRVEKTYIDTV